MMRLDDLIVFLRPLFNTLAVLLAIVIGVALFVGFCIFINRASDIGRIYLARRRRRRFHHDATLRAHLDRIARASVNGE